MAYIIGQVYNPRFKTEEKNGASKSTFYFSLATRKAFVDEGEGPNLFTQCVVYQGGLANALNEYFGKEEHKGKAIAVMGHFNEYEWMPDPENPQHDRYFQEFKITPEYFAQGNITLAPGSVQELTIHVPIKQITRQFVVTGFEFADSASPSVRPQATNTPAKIKVSSPSSASEFNAPVVDDDKPF